MAGRGEMLGEKERMSVFIDLENVEQGMMPYNEKGLVLDYKALVQVLSEGFKLEEAVAYDAIPAPDNNYMHSFHQRLKDGGLIVRTFKPNVSDDPERRVSRQKEVDTSMVADMVEKAYTDRFDTAVIISGDRDMRPGIEAVRRAGKECRVAGLFEITCGAFKHDRATVFIDDLFVMRSAPAEEDHDYINIARGQPVQEAYPHVA